MLEWLGFLLAMVALLLISQKNLGLAMFTGAFILGVFMVPDHLVLIFAESLTDPSVLLLTLTVSMIPVIGGTLKTSGKMDDLVKNMRIGKKAFLMLSPALIGLLPMPGGALLSSPLVDKGGVGISNKKKAGLNVWFRHVLYLVYPLSPSLIVATEIAYLDMYNAIPVLIPLLLAALFLGYFFFLKDISGEIKYEEKLSPKKLLLVLLALLIAPTLDISLKTLFVLPVEEVATLIGVSGSLLLSVMIGGVKASGLRKIVKIAKPWNFALMILGIMVFLNVFKSSGILQLIQALPLTRESLFVIGFMLGFGTGRMITPAGIIFPIFLVKFGQISPFTFAVIYFGIFLGYIITPVHPCVSLSVESFDIKLKEYLKVITPPTIIAFIIGYMLLLTL